jgi:fumarate reductase subunit D
MGSDNTLGTLVPSVPVKQGGGFWVFFSYAGTVASSLIHVVEILGSCFLFPSTALDCEACCCLLNMVVAPILELPPCVRLVGLVSIVTVTVVP